MKEYKYIITSKVFDNFFQGYCPSKFIIIVTDKKDIRDFITDRKKENRINLKVTLV